MNRKNALLIFAAAWVSAALLTWVLYAATKTPRVEKTVAVVAAARDMPAGTLLRKGDVTIVHLRDGEVPRNAIVDQNAALDRPLLFPAAANQALTTSVIASTKGIEGLPATIDVGMRAITIPINDASGVAGLIQPRAHVDVLFTRTGQISEAITTTLLEDVVVLAMGRTTEAVTSAATATSAQAQAIRPAAQSATLLVSPDDAQKIELAKNLGKMSLSLRNPLDETGLETDTAATANDIYPGMGHKEPPVHAPPPPPPPKVVERVAPPPKPAPKHVVEVFRGSQHVQEILK